MVLVTDFAAYGVVLGIVLGLGLWSLVSLLPKLSRPSLADRVAPYLVDVSAGARELVARRSVDPLPVLGMLFAPTFRVAGGALSGILGGNETVSRRLAQSRSTSSCDRFRSEQLICGVLSAALGIVLVLALATSRSVPALSQIALPIVAGGCGILARDLVLRRAATKRLARIQSELPTVLEFLTLSLSAGEGVLDSLRRVAQVSNGELSREFARVVSEVNTGVSLIRALETRAAALQLGSFTRMVEQVAGALERGTPLTEVLKAQAQDARDDAKRDLLEVAGTKEVAMLVPLVFLVLPVTILFAVYPGIFVLQSGF